MEDCTLCKDIEGYDDYRQLFKNIYVKEDGKIVYVKETNEYCLTHDGGGDPFQCGICLQGINYCPYCGRDLNENM